MATAKVSCVALIHGHKLLIGKRNDDGRWNLPGGHHEKGETPAEACSRECEEETGIHIDPDSLIFLGARKVKKKSGKKVKVYAFKFEVDKTKEVKANDSEEEHDWTWVNTSNGLPKEVIRHWHNEDDVVLNYLGLMGRNEDIPNDDLIEKSVSEAIGEALEKRKKVKGQDASMGVASEVQRRFMQVVASGKASGHQPSKEEAKEYLANSGKKEDDDKAEKVDTKDNYSEAVVGEHIKRQNRPRAATFAQDVARVKQKYAGKKPKTFDEQVASVKERYRSSLDKTSELFYAKLEKCLDLGFNEELASGMMDLELQVRSLGGNASSLYKAVDDVCDELMSKEEQVVVELSHLAKCGDEDAYDQLVLFTSEMYDELLKHSSMEEAVEALVKGHMTPIYITAEDRAAEHQRLLSVLRSKDPEKLDAEAEVQEQALIRAKNIRDDHKSSNLTPNDVEGEAAQKSEDAEKSNYGPKGMGLYSQADNVGRKQSRTGVVHEDVGHNQAEQRYTPSVHGTMAQQAARESKRDQQRSAQNPVKVYTEEEKAALMRERTGKSADNSRVVGKKNGASVRRVHGYLRYTSGPKRGEYVHRHEAEKRLGRKLKSSEEVNHKGGDRSGKSGTEVMSASKHASKTDHDRANGKGYSGRKRYEHSRD